MRALFIISSLFGLVYQSTTWAQPYAPLLKNDRHWIYSQMAPEEPAVHISVAFALSMQGDTMFQGSLYKKIYQHTLRLNAASTSMLQPKQILQSSLYAFIREDTIARKVYFLPLQDTFFACQSTEHLLYDFSLLKGDTLNDCVLDNLYEPFLMFLPQVDSIRWEEHLGSERRAFYTTGVFVNEGMLSFSPGQLIEGFGYKAHGLINFGRKGILVRFEDYCEGDFPQCGFVSASSEPNATPKLVVTVSPNPARDVISLQLDQHFQHETVIQVSILNAAGKVAQQTNCSAMETVILDIHNLQNGMYILKIRGENVNAIAKLFIAH